MSGYKQSIIDSDAASLWTFDGDAFDSVNRNLLVPNGEPMVIIDEIDNLNPAILHVDNPQYHGYRLGMPSLVTHEQTDQYSCSFGYYGNIPNHPSGYPKAYLEVPHTSSYMFPRFGSFTVEFLMNKDRESGYGMTCGLSRPIIRKSGVFNMKLDIPCYSSTTFSITHPGGSTSFNFDSYLGKSLYSRTLHMALTWLVERLDNGNYRGTARVYLNARIISEQVYTYLDTFPNTNVASPIEIAGLIGSNLITQDRHTSSFRMDQIAIYDKSLTQDQVADHYSKAFPYEKMIENDFARNLWPFNDIDSITDFTIKPAVGTLVGKYSGDRTQIIRQITGPAAIPQSTGARFVNEGCALFTSIGASTQYSVILNTASNYTIEFWFLVTSTNRGILFSCQSFEQPYNGVCIQMNMMDNSPIVGSLQFTESNNDVILNSKFLTDNGNRKLMNDGKWHHLVVLRVGSQLQLWIDGNLDDEKISPIKSVSQPGQITMMNMMPGRLNCNGSLSELAIYEFNLQPHQIRARVTYSIIYRVRGIVTLLGIPYQATLRFYKSSTGELIQELQSDPDTGEYLATFYDNSNVDLLVFDKDDRSVRYRAYGPITPSEFTDLPIII